MNKNFQISFFNNDNGVSVGALSCANRSLLSTTHPATIAYALQALGADSVEINCESSHFELALPSVLVLQNQLLAVGTHAKWMLGFIQFSQIDAFNPSAIDSQADTYLRTAIHFLPKEMVQRKPLGKLPSNWKAGLRFHKQFIYYPIC